MRLARLSLLKKIYRAKHVLSKVEGTPTNKIRNPNIEIRNKLKAKPAKIQNTNPSTGLEFSDF
jgi:hypothetical protein